MSYIDELLGELTARLPELEWKINNLAPAAFSSKTIPRGLFNSYKELNPKVCIDEIKNDLLLLNTTKSQYSSLYLAEKIQRKINLLVTLCQLDKKRKKISPSPSFGLNMLSTRHQWIVELEQKVHTLESQHQAVIKTLTQMEKNANLEAVLNLKSELGELERRLTLAREALQKACS